MSEEIIKCNSCGQILISGKGLIKCFFGSGTTISCRNCENKYTFEKPSVLTTSKVMDKEKKSDE